jgi:hypothetical protein
LRKKNERAGPSGVLEHCLGVVANGGMGPKENSVGRILVLEYERANMHEQIVCLAIRFTVKDVGFPAPWGRMP